jgi:hypothetical protein
MFMDGMKVTDGDLPEESNYFSLLFAEKER